MTENTTTQQTPKKKCFVVMGFGEKTDFATGRTLDLDKSYRLIIKKDLKKNLNNLYLGLFFIGVWALLYFFIVEYF